MSTLPLELHEVLEEEYLSMYGPLEKPGTDAVEVLDDRWAHQILQECGLPLTGEETVGQRLKKLIDGPEPLEPLSKSPALTDRGRYLLDNHAEDPDIEVRRKIVDEAFTGAVKPLRDVRLENVYRAIHDRRAQGKPRTALCISGGGIRSATFALGVMQGLSSVNILDKFDYLSTVSGGGYIGSWLSSWVRRNRDGVTGVQQTLRDADTALAPPPAADEMVRPDGQTAPKAADRELPDHKVYPEPTPLRHLRAYSNYLSPSLSLFSGDTWTLASLYLRNLLLNLLVLVPLLAFALAVPRIFSWLIALKEPFAPAAWAWIAAGLTTYGFAYLGVKRPVVQGRKARLTATTDGWFILNCILPLTGAAVALAVLYARTKEPNPEVLLTSPSVIAAGVVALLGMTLVPYLLYYGRVFQTHAAERRASFSTGRQIHVRKQLNELFAVIVAVLTTVVLLWLLANKVFDNPVLPISNAATLAPIDRVNEPMSMQAQLYVCFAVPLVLLVFFVQASIFVGLSGRQNEDYDREWWGRAGAWLIAFAVVLGVFNAIALFGPIAFYYAPVIIASAGGVAGIGAALFGFSGKSSATKKGEQKTTEKASNMASALAVPIFIAALLAAISLGTTWLIQEFHSDEDKRHVVQPDQYKEKAALLATYTRTEPVAAEGKVQKLETAKTPRVSVPELQATAHLQTVQRTTFTHVWIFAAVGAFAVVLSFFIGANKFSMAALYRNRIIRAYLGASRYNRDPELFTGFDENDNLQMWELRPELLWPSNVRDPLGLVLALTKGESEPARRLFDSLEPSTQAKLKPEQTWTRKAFAKLIPKALQKDETKPLTHVEGTVVDALVQNLNALLLGDNLAAKLDVTEPAWLNPPEPAEGEPKREYFPYPAAVRNRAVLDAQFGAYIDAMVPPADSGQTRPATSYDPQTPRGRSPLHVVNTALNLTSGENLAWQQRMATSFSVSPLHCGNLALGYRRSSEYGGGDGISLGTAVGISGAAASPNMGYHSSPTVAFLLTFFNVRLGAWLGNPGPRGDSSYNQKHPRSGLIPLVSELTGNSNAKSKWVYLSDGGHFENLALYEMVVRRCHDIVLSDGGADPKCTFEDLGNAIRKIRIDLGIPIEVESITNMHPRSENGQPVAGEYVLHARIRYDAVDANARPGHLTYIKPGVYKGDYFPVDVYNYAMESPAFPHEPTGDQFFSESQFESYRALGRHAIDVLYVQRDAATGARLTIKKPQTVTDFNRFVAERTPRQPEAGGTAS